MNNVKLNRINGKKMEVEIKNGATMENFLEKYNCTRDEFLEYLHKNFSENARNSMLRSIAKNSKKIKKQSRNEQQLIMDEEKSCEVTMEMHIEELAAVTTDNNDQKLQEMKKKEKNLELQIYEQEKEHQKNLSKRRSLFEQLRIQKEKMLELKKIIEKRQLEVENISKEINEVTNKISVEKDELFNNKQILEETRDYIKNLEKISIFVYENGEIEIENSETPEITDWQNEFETLINDEAVENLSVKQIRQLAKLTVLEKQFEKEGKEYELTIEDEIVEKIVKTINLKMP